MKCLFLVARREIAANSHILFVASAIGLLPLLLPFAPGLDLWPYAVVRSVSSVFCAVALAFMLSVALGWSVIGKDLAERRLSFYFSRPIPSGAIWGGRFLGAALIVLVAGILELLPAALLSGDMFQTVVHWMGSLMSWLRSPYRSLPWLHMLPPSSWWWLFPAVVGAICIFLLAFSHALGIIVRSRSAWAALHFPLIFCAVLWAAGSARRLMEGHAIKLLFCSGVLLACVVMVALWAALGTQVSLGRTEPQRGHHVLSRVLWPLIFVGLLGFDVCSRWIVNAAIQDLVKVWAVGGTNNGTWISVSGRAANRGNYNATFVFDTATGRSLRTGAAEGGGWTQDLPLISRNGNRAVWLKRNDANGLQSLFTADLDARSPEPVRVSIPISGITELAISGDGTRVALLQTNLVGIYRLPQGEFVGGTSLHCPDTVASAVQFLAADMVRIYVSSSDTRVPGSSRIEILEFEAAAKIVKTTGRILAFTFVFLPSDPSLQRMAVWRMGRQGVQVSLCDARTGEERKGLLPEGITGAFPHFISDGRVVILNKQEQGRARMHVFSSEGDLERVIELPGTAAILGTEYAPARLVVAVSQDPHRPDWALYLVDLGNGETHRSAGNLRPINLGDYRPPVFRCGASTPGGLESHLYMSPELGLVQFDPLSGTERTLIGSADLAARRTNR